MEDLNAQQIVLLTLLVSFVTSIATGIVTVSLLEQAPEPVTQTINRVVEKTVERVVEVEPENQPEPQIERIVETVIVNAEDLTVEAVAKNSNNIVRIFSKAGGLKNFVGIGVIVSADGQILTDSINISSGVDYVAEYPIGEKELEITFNETDSKFAILNIIGENVETFSVAQFGDSQSLQLAQTVIAISGSNNNVVGTGIINSLGQDSVDSGAEGSVTKVDTSIDPAKMVVGAILINLKGEIVGINIGESLSATASFMPINEAKIFLASTT